MPKRAGNLYYTELATRQTAKVAIWASSEHKRDRTAVAVHLEPGNFERDADWLADLMRRKAWRPLPPIMMTIQDGPHKKRREIAVPAYWPDQAVHWMLMLTISPLIMRGMYRYNCGSVPRRGTHSAVRSARRMLEEDPRGCAWALQLDIEHFYASIDCAALMDMLRRIIKDQDVLDTVQLILDSYSPGLPIGYFTSQWFANLYLQGIDHYIKEALRIPHYVRYMDDMLLMGPNKRELLRAKASLDTELAKIGLRIRDADASPGKESWAIFRPREQGIHYLGFMIKPFRVSETVHRYKWMITMDQDNMLRTSRRVQGIYRRAQRRGALSLDDARQVVGAYAVARAGNNWRWECDHLRPFADYDKAREVISRADKEQAAALKLLHHHPPR